MTISDWQGMTDWQSLISTRFPIPVMVGVVNSIPTGGIFAETF